MRTAVGLLTDLGVSHATPRHIRTIDEFIESGKTDVKELLNELGGWDANDLEIAERWMKQV